MATATQTGKIRLRLEGPQGVVLELDRSKYYPDDPGQDTPAIVAYKGGTSTYHCCMDHGYVESSRTGDIDIPRAAMKWLEAMEDVVDQFLYRND